MAERTFPEYFAEYLPYNTLGQLEPNDPAFWEQAYEFMRICRSLIPFKVQIEFERADLGYDDLWFERNWSCYKNGMVYHALATFPIFQWTNFCNWLEKIAVNDHSAREAIILFQNHPSYNA